MTEPGTDGPHETYADFDFDAFQRGVIEEFRANDGRVGGLFEGSTLALVTTIGARTGRPRTSPLAHLEIDGQPVVVASAMGAPKHPDWYHNIRRHPTVTVELGTDTYQAVAGIPTGAARDALFAAVVERDPGFGEYQARTSRIIPVITLTRIPAPAWDRGLGDFLVEGHEWLRRELASLRRQADDLLPRAGAGAGAGDRVAFRRQALAFCDALEEHHTGEDRGAFPLVADRFPGLAAALEALAAEHLDAARLHRALRDLALADGPEPGGPGPEQASLPAVLDELAAHLEDHFRYEERTVIAPLNALGPAPDID